MHIDGLKQISGIDFAYTRCLGYPHFPSFDLERHLLAFLAVRLFYLPGHAQNNSSGWQAQHGVSCLAARQLDVTRNQTFRECLRDLTWHRKFKSISTRDNYGRWCFGECVVKQVKINIMLLWWYDNHTIITYWCFCSDKWNVFAINRRLRNSVTNWIFHSTLSKCHPININYFALLPTILGQCMCLSSVPFQACFIDNGAILYRSLSA